MVKVTELGTKVEPSDKIEVNGVLIEKEALHTYFFYKTTLFHFFISDDKGRKTVVNFFKDVPYRLYPVGRLDYDTSAYYY